VEKTKRRRKSSSPDARRAKLRDQLWPGSEKWIWDINDPVVVGFATMPRLIPLIMFLIKRLAGGKHAGDPSQVYLDLWSRDRGQGLVVIDDEDECSFSCGYTSGRALRTWRAHILKLQELGFILIKPKGNRECGHILLLDPLAVCARLHEEGKVQEDWWAAFVAGASAIGATIPPPLCLPRPPKAAIRLAPLQNNSADLEDGNGTEFVEQVEKMP
jgi:hypothetical protein